MYCLKTSVALGNNLYVSQINKLSPFSNSSFFCGIHELAEAISHITGHVRVLPLSQSKPIIHATNVIKEALKSTIGLQKTCNKYFFSVTNPPLCNDSSVNERPGLPKIYRRSLPYQGPSF